MAGLSSGIRRMIQAQKARPVVDYNLYLDLRENVDAVSMFQHEDEWRGLHKEE